MTRNDIAQAAFWDYFICIDCGTQAEHDGPTCPECGGPNWVPAETLQAFIDGLDEVSETA